MVAMMYGLYEPGHNGEIRLSGWSITLPNIRASLSMNITHGLSSIEEALKSPENDRASAGARIEAGTSGWRDEVTWMGEGTSGDRLMGDDTGVDRQTKAKRKRTFKNFVCRYANSSFVTRTHVFVNVGGRPEEPKVGGRPLRITKNQLIQDNLRFDEVDVLKEITRRGPASLLCNLGNLPSLKGRKQIRLALEQ